MALYILLFISVIKPGLWGRFEFGDSSRIMVDWLKAEPTCVIWQDFWETVGPFYDVYRRWLQIVIPSDLNEFSLGIYAVEIEMRDLKICGRVFVDECKCGAGNVGIAS